MLSVPTRELEFIFLVEHINFEKERLIDNKPIYNKIYKF